VWDKQGLWIVTTLRIKIYHIWDLNVKLFHDKIVDIGKNFKKGVIALRSAPWGAAGVGGYFPPTRTDIEQNITVGVSTRSEALRAHWAGSAEEGRTQGGVRRLCRQAVPTNTPGACY
jgi:hypothetical protein